MSENLEPDELMGKINLLKEKAAQYTEKLDTATERRAVVKSKLSELGEKLSSVQIGLQFGSLRTAIDAASESAKRAAEALAEALEGLDLDDF